MDAATAEILKVVGAVAGIGGIALIMLLLIFKDVIKAQIAVRLTRAQFFLLMTLVLLLTFAIAASGVLCYAVITIKLDNNKTTQNVSQMSNQVTQLQSDYGQLKQKYDGIEDKMLKARTPAIEVVDQSVNFDLSKRTAVALEDRKLKRVSQVLTTKSFTLRRAYNEQTSFSTTAGSSSFLDPIFSSTTHHLVAKQNSDPMPVGTDSLRRWVLDFDISSEPLFKAFELTYTGTFWNSFQGESSEWAETAIFAPTKVASISIDFPPSKPFQPGSLKFKYYPWGANQPREDYPKPEVLADENGKRVKWTIRDPQVGYHYRIEWNW